MKNNVTKISDFTLDLEIDNAWDMVKQNYLNLIAYDRIMPKAISRSGKATEKAIRELIESLKFYDQLRSKR